MDVEKMTVHAVRVASVFENVRAGVGKLVFGAQRIVVTSKKNHLGLD